MSLTEAQCPAEDFTGIGPYDAPSTHLPSSRPTPSSSPIDRLSLPPFSLPTFAHPLSGPRLAPLSAHHPWPPSSVLSRHPPPLNSPALPTLDTPSLPSTHAPFSPSLYLPHPSTSSQWTDNLNEGLPVCFTSKTELPDYVHGPEVRFGQRTRERRRHRSDRIDSRVGQEETRSLAVGSHAATEA